MCQEKGPAPTDSAQSVEALQPSIRTTWQSFVRDAKVRGRAASKREASLWHAISAPPDLYESMWLSCALPLG